ncbi:DUF6221 family protein [Streptacidiphilus sp. PAMC 29251]
MPDVSLADLAAAVRAGLDAEAEGAQAATPGPWRSEHWADGQHRVRGAGSRLVHCDGGYPSDWPTGVVNPRADADHIERHDPDATLARVARTRRHVELLVGEEHGFGWTEQCHGEPCLCGRDERVRAYLTLLLTTEEA